MSAPRQWSLRMRTCNGCRRLITGQALQEMPVNLWLWEAYPVALSQSEMLQCAFHDMSEHWQDDYPKHLEPALQRAMKLQATPPWAIDFFIKATYHLAKLRSNVFGFKWHVDHIVPLKPQIVCGLRCEANLQVIPGIANLSKGNGAWPDMPRRETGGG